MPTIGSKIIPLGRTYHGAAVDDAYWDSTQSDYVGETAIGLEGTVCTYAAPNPLNRVAKVDRNDVTLVLVRNVSGEALIAGNAVTWKAGFRYKRVDGNARTTSAEIAGIVDPFLPAAGAPNGDLFWLWVKGITMIRPGYDGTSNVWSAASRLVAFTAANSTGNTGKSTGGKLTPYADTSNLTNALTLFAAVRAVAISACTAAETGGRSAWPTAGKLVYLVSSEY